MKNQQQQLQIQQLENKLNQFKILENSSIPPKGWINAIRTALGMSLRQLGNQLDISLQSVKEIEEREVSGSITLKNLNEAAKAMNMKLVYGLVPVNGSLHEMIEKKAMEIATEIVKRTSDSMALEDQKNSNTRLAKAIQEKAAELKRTIPKYLWD